MTNTSENKFHVQLTLRIDWSEMDLFGHVNNVMFMKYIQASRVNYWEKINLLRDMELSKTGPMLLSTSCRFHKPLHYPGSITIEAKMDFIKNTSFGISHRILNDKNDLAAEAQDVIVMYDFNKNEKIKFPDDIRRAVEILEEKNFTL